MSIGLYKIADTMQVPLTLDGAKVSGSADFCFNGTQNSLSLPFTVTAKYLFDFHQTGVLFHVMGKLYVLVAYNSEHAAQSLFVINGSQCTADGVLIPPEKLMGSKLTLRETVDLFGDAVVKAYACQRDGAWRQINYKK